jgi:hypothetical protein
LSDIMRAKGWSFVFIATFLAPNVVPLSHSYVYDIRNGPDTPELRGET